MTAQDVADTLNIDIFTSRFWLRSLWETEEIYRHKRYNVPYYGPEPAEDVIRHGIYAWQKGTCRCKVCEQAERDHRARQAERRRASRDTPPDDYIERRQWELHEIVLAMSDMSAREVAEKTGRTLEGVRRFRWRLQNGRR